MFLQKEKIRKQKKVSENNKLPQDIVDHWPEIFDDIEIQSVPIQYLSAIDVKFLDGKIWEIEIDADKFASTDPVEIEQSIETFFQEYEDAIDTVNFRLNTDKLKHDISKRTAIFMKKRK